MNDTYGIGTEGGAGDPGSPVADFQVAQHIRLERLATQNTAQSQPKMIKISY